ncbi:MAG TPA: Rieske 2Fe-2S domain-containing protein [Sphingobium sp.]|nr:Rieske 2Fe-2S domain-containing protein [Sphingobium sp.]
MAEDSGSRTMFSCRYHMWTFDQEGQLRAAPDLDRFFMDRADCGLPKVPVGVCGGLIFVNFDPAPAQSLKDFLGVLADELEKLPVAMATGFSEYVYDIDANGSWYMIISRKIIIFASFIPIP